MITSSRLLAVFVTFITLGVLVASFPLAQATAASPSPHLEPTPTASVGATTTKLRERIEKIVEEKRDQIAGVLDELGENRRGYIGQIERLTSETLTIRTNRGPRIVSLTSDIVITRGTSRIEPNAIAVGDWVIAIGTMRDDELRPERLLVSTASLRPKPQVVMIGSITALSKTSLTLQSRANNEERQFALSTANTTYQDLNGDKVALADISVPMQAVVIGQENTTAASPSPTSTTPTTALIVRVLVIDPQPSTPPSPSPRARAASPTPRATPQ